MQTFISVFAALVAAKSFEFVLIAAVGTLRAKLAYKKAMRLQSLVNAVKKTTN